MTPADAVRLTQGLIDSFKGPQGEPDPRTFGWKVRCCPTEEIMRLCDHADGMTVWGLTRFQEREILLSEEYISDDAKAREMINHEMCHLLSHDHRCEVSTGANSAAFIAASQELFEHYQEDEEN